MTFLFGNAEFIDSTQFLNVDKTGPSKINFMVEFTIVSKVFEVSESSNTKSLNSNLCTVELTQASKDLNLNIFICVRLSNF